MQKISALNPFIIFWLGVLTGALLVGLLFLYKVTGGDLQTSVLKTPAKQQYKSATVKTKAPTGLKNTGDPNPWLGK